MKVHRGWDAACVRFREEDWRLAGSEEPEKGDSYPGQGRGALIWAGSRNRSIRDGVREVGQSTGRHAPNPVVGSVQG